MHPVSKKCIKSAVVLFLVGAAIVVLVPLWGTLAGGLGSNPGFVAVNALLSLLHTVTIPTGASLIGAAVVIQVLAPAYQRSTTRESNLAE